MNGQSSTDKPWYQNPGCLIAILVVAGLLWFMHVNCNPRTYPNATDPSAYEDDPLYDPDMHGGHGGRYGQ